MGHLLSRPKFEPKLARCAGPGTYNTELSNKVRQIVMHEETVNINGRLFVEQIIFEMDYEQKTWKRLKRKKPLKQ